MLLQMTHTEVLPVVVAANGVEFSRTFEVHAGKLGEHGRPVEHASLTKRTLAEDEAQTYTCTEREET